MAKSAAGAPASTLNAVRCLKSAGEALLQEAAVLGAVTRAANSHRTQVVTASGEVATVVRRDSITPSVAPRRDRGGVRRDTVIRPTTPSGVAAGIACVGTCKRKARAECASADVVARAKRRRLDALAVVIARARDERVAMRMLGEAAAKRDAADVECHARIDPILEAHGDSMSSAFVAAVTRVRDSNGVVGPRDRFAALRAKVAAKQPQS